MVCSNSAMIGAELGLSTFVQHIGGQSYGQFYVQRYGKKLIVPLLLNQQL